MQTETQATDTTETAQTVDTTAATTEAPASAAATATEDTSTTTEKEGESGTPQDEQPRDDKGQFKSGAQKRIDTLVFQRHQAEREAAYWKEQAQSTAKAAAVPKLADFDTHDEFDQALLDHRIADGVNRGLAKTAEQQATKFSQQAQSAAAEAYNQRVTETVARIPDFVDVVRKSNVPMSPALHEALMDSDKGPELVYHLAKNPGEAERLNAMSVRQMDREIGRLETTFSAKAPAPPAARTTSAPAPIKPGSQASAPANTDPSKMDQTQFEAWAKANGSRYIR